MFRNVLVGVDGRQGGRDAIALARLLAAPQATITLAHIYDQDGAIGRGAAMALAAERELSAELLSAAKARAELDARLVSQFNQHPARGLHELAEERAADLLVIGSTRHAVLGRALIADHTRAALNGAPCAIAIAPRGYTQMDQSLETIGVGYDGTAESELALATARELADRYEATITALWVVSLQDVRDKAPIPADWPKATEELVARCATELKAHGIDAEVAYGGPKEELSQLGDRVDLLILGSRSYGPIHRLFHGTTSTYLTRHIGAPLLQLPRTAKSASNGEPGVAADEPAAVASQAPA